MGFYRFYSDLMGFNRISMVIFMVNGVFMVFFNGDLMGVKGYPRLMGFDRRFHLWMSYNPTSWGRTPTCC